jgi:hypothetical protein
MLLSRTLFAPQYHLLSGQKLPQIRGKNYASILCILKLILLLLQKQVNIPQILQVSLLTNEMARFNTVN